MLKQVLNRLLSGDKNKTESEATAEKAAVTNKPVTDVGNYSNNKIELLQQKTTQSGFDIGCWQ